MRVLQFSRGLAAFVFGALLVPGLGNAQEVTVLSKEISVGRNEAVLRLELSSDESLEIALRAGSVSIDGESSGSYEAGGPLDVAWRALLGNAVSLDNGALSEMLRDWSPPASVTGRSLDLARSIDQALEAGLSARVDESAGELEDVQFSVGSRSGGDILRVLLSQVTRLGALEEALAGLDEGFAIYLDEDVDIARGESVDGTLVVIQGNVRVEGTVSGDVVVVDGTLELLEGSRVRGEVRLADARLLRNEGTVDGEVMDVARNERVLESEIRERVRTELMDEFGATDVPRFEAEPRSFTNPFSRAAEGVAGVFQNLVAILMIGLLGMGVLAFASENLDAVAETAKKSPGRSAMVGVAGTFLLLPVWILGAVALTVTIVGIPVMIAWLPLFPVAALMAGVLGYLAVARNTGEWLAESEYRYTDWIRKSNPVYTMAGGLVGLMAFFIAANVLSILPFFGFFRGLLAFAGVVLTILAVMIGFGAVLLTKGGRQRPYYPNDDLDAAWEAVMDVEVEVDPTPGDEAESGEDQTDA